MSTRGHRRRALLDPARGGIASSSGSCRIVLEAQDRPDRALGYTDNTDLFAAREDARPPRSPVTTKYQKSANLRAGSIDDSASRKHQSINYSRRSDALVAPRLGVCPALVRSHSAGLLSCTEWKPHLGRRRSHYPPRFTFLGRTGQDLDPAGYHPTILSFGPYVLLGRAPALGRLTRRLSPGQYRPPVPFGPPPAQDLAPA